jgi:alkanesulfonate monooxygenase SsuD/methylene tetrahydromethanopterin reductase-like flavin-dependent oxidoreductase (luciferase family)
MSWPDMLSRALETEALGFDGLYLVDHFYGLKDLDDPTHEAYTMLGALAPFTQRVRLGVIVAGNTYRNPVFLLKQAITVDHISGGRVDFGVGAGWVEREHEAYSWYFPSAKERVDRFAEALEIWDLLQSNERTTYEGTYYQVLDAPFQPKSLQSPRLPVLIGGSGNRMLRLTAKHADIWNVVGTPEEARSANVRMNEACAAVDRDPNTLVRCVSPTLNLLASPQAFIDGVQAYHDAGIRDIYMPWPRVEAEVPVLREVARNVLPGLRGKSNYDTPAEPDRAPFLSASNDDVRAAIGELSDNQRSLLGWLVGHPDERFDGAALQEALGIAAHRDVTLAFAHMSGLFHDRGIARPWNEAQRGYLVSADAAGLLKAAGVK